MNAVQTQPASDTDYPAPERESLERRDVVEGGDWAMAGASPRHHIISGNIHGELRARLRDGPCRPILGGQRVHVPGTELYTYLDVTVICGPPEFHADDRTSLCNPCVIFEVLSDATEAWDRGGKFGQFRRCGSLAEYVLVSQRERLVEHFRRTPEGQWLLTEYRDDATVELLAIDCSLALDDIYLDAPFYPSDAETSG